jgi:hypothetical protein
LVAGHQTTIASDATPGLGSRPEPRYSPSTPIAAHAASDSRQAYSQLVRDEGIRMTKVLSSRRLRCVAANPRKCSSAFSPLAFVTLVALVLPVAPAAAGQGIPQIEQVRRFGTEASDVFSAGTLSSQQSERMTAPDSRGRILSQGSPRGVQQGGEAPSGTSTQASRASVRCQVSGGLAPPNTCHTGRKSMN